MSVQQQPFPTTNSPAAEGRDDPLANIWYYLLRTLWQRLGGSGATLPAVSVSPDGSTFIYSTDISGSISITGGTVSAIEIVRGTSLVPTGMTFGLFPLLRGDSIAVTYSVAPTVTFLPSEFVQTAT